MEPLPRWMYYATGLMILTLVCLGCFASMPALARLVPTRAAQPPIMTPTLTPTIESRVKDKPTRMVTVIPIQEPTPTPLPTFTRPATARPTPTQSRFTGQGDRLERFSLERSGLVQFSLSHGGEQNFIVWLLDPGGEKLELLANEVGDYSGETAIRLEPGNYFLQIEADGQWLISLAVE